MEGLEGGGFSIHTMNHSAAFAFDGSPSWPQDTGCAAYLVQEVVTGLPH